MTTQIELIKLASDRLLEQAIDSYIELMRDIGYEPTREEAIAWLLADGWPNDE